MPEYQLGDPIVLFNDQGEQIHDLDFDQDEKRLNVVNYSTKNVLYSFNLLEEAFQLQVSGLDLFIDSPQQDREEILNMTLSQTEALFFGIFMDSIHPGGTEGEEIAFFVGSEDFRICRLTTGTNLSNNTIEIEIEDGVFKLSLIQ